MMIFKNMSIAVSTSIICASLFFGDVNAITVPIVDGNGKQVGELQDNAAPLPINGLGSTIYHLNAGNMEQVDKSTSANDSLYFYIAKNQYVKVDCLESDLVRNRLQNINNTPIPQKLKKLICNLNLCTKLPINWNATGVAIINEYKNILNDKWKIVEKAFNGLQGSVNNGKDIIEAVKNSLLYTDLKKTQQRPDLPNTQEIVDRYTILKMCFERNNANEAIEYLLLKDTEGKSDNEQKIMNNVRDYFKLHIPKHFCSNDLMNGNTQNFNDAGIDEPQEGQEYTSLSYNVDNFESIKAIASSVFPQVVQHLKDNCTFDFIQDYKQPSCFTIKLKSSEKYSIEDQDGLQSMCKLNYACLKEICKYQNETSNVIYPDIYNVGIYKRKKDDSVKNETQLLAQHESVEYREKLFYLFFNISFNLDYSVKLTLNQGIHGSFFPVNVKS